MEMANISFTMVQDDKQLSDVNTDDIVPDDSVSKATKSKAASKSVSSGTSSYACIQVEAETAAILGLVAALDEKKKKKRSRNS